MSVSSQSGRGRGALTVRVSAILATSAVIAAGLGAGPASSDPVDTCPAPVGAGNAHAGDAVTGLTVDSGTAPSGFSGTVLGVLTDGIAPGIPMIMVRLTSAEIDRVGGIWEGMSGSPVYASDGKLLGAVAYGLSFGPSPVAGITPAEDMESLAGSSTTSSARPVGRQALPDTLQDKIVSSGAASKQQADAGMSQLRTPFSLNGARGNPAELAKLTKHLKLGGNIRTVAGGNTSGSSAGDSSTIVPGGNIAASMSYGDVTAAGVGTTTAICNSQVLAFGHPFNFTGASTMTMHSADTIYVQEDPTLAPFKVANITGAVGTIDQDRLEGIAGPLGVLPKTSDVTSSVTTPRGSRTGTTYISVPDYFSDLAATHVYSDVVRQLDGTSAGSGGSSYRIEGTRENGKPFTLARSEAVADHYDIADGIAFDLYDVLARLQYNSGEDLTFTHVRTRSNVEPVFRAYQVASVDRLAGGSWRKLNPKTPVTVHAGSLQHFRVLLTSKNMTSRRVAVNVRIPAGAAGRTGLAELFGGNSGRSASPLRLHGSKLDRIIEQVEATPSNGQVVTRLRIYTPGGHKTLDKTSKVSTGHVVNGGTQVRLRVIH